MKSSNVMAALVTLGLISLGTLKNLVANNLTGKGDTP